MPIKKSDLYSSLWKSCDELRGGMDASQYRAIGDGMNKIVKALADQNDLRGSSMSRIGTTRTSWARGRRW